MCYQPTTCNLLCISTWSCCFDETASALWEKCSRSKSSYVFFFSNSLFYYLFVFCGFCVLCVFCCFQFFIPQALGDRTLRQQYRSSLKAEMRGISMDMLELLNFQLCNVLLILVHSDAFSIIQRCRRFSS